MLHSSLFIGLTLVFLIAERKERFIDIKNNDSFLVHPFPSHGSQIKEYKLISKTEKADFNYKSLKFIDRKRTSEKLRNAFNPVNGKSTVYVFIATNNGLSYNNRVKEFHDILIVKTDSKNIILDAYQYTLEWAEPPLSFDLYKATAKGLKLANGLSIENLDFRRTDFYTETDRELKETGVIMLPHAPI